MTAQDTIRRYRRLSILLLAVACETDANWAAQIIDYAKHRRTGLSLEIVRETYRAREKYRNDPDATRAVDCFLQDELKQNTSADTATMSPTP